MKIFHNFLQILLALNQATILNYFHLFEGAIVNFLLKLSMMLSSGM